MRYYLNIAARKQAAPCFHTVRLMRGGAAERYERAELFLLFPNPLILCRLGLIHNKNIILQKDLLVKPDCILLVTLAQSGLGAVRQLDDKRIFRHLFSSSKGIYRNTGHFHDTLVSPEQDLFKLHLPLAVALAKQP